MKESTAEEGSTFNASFESSSVSPTLISTTSVTSHEIPSSKPEPGQSKARPTYIEYDKALLFKVSVAS